MYYKLVESKGEFDLKDQVARKQFCDSSEDLGFGLRELHRGEVKRTWQVFEESQPEDKLKFSVTLYEDTNAYLYRHQIETLIRIDFPEHKSAVDAWKYGDSIDLPIAQLVGYLGDGSTKLERYIGFNIHLNRLKEEYWPLVVEKLKKEPLNLPSALIDEIINLYYPAPISEAELRFGHEVDALIQQRKYMEVVELAHAYLEEWGHYHFEHSDALYKVANKLAKIPDAQDAAYAACCRATNTPFEYLILPLRQALAQAQIAAATSEEGRLAWQRRALYISLFANKHTPSDALLPKDALARIFASVVPHPLVKDDINEMAEEAVGTHGDHYPAFFYLMNICKKLSDSLTNVEAKLQAIASSRQQSAAETEDTTHFKNLSLMYDRLNQKSSANAAAATANTSAARLNL